jgi:hypothetical protein
MYLAISKFKTAVKLAFLAEVKEDGETTNEE